MKQFFAMIILWFKRVARATMFPHEMNLVCRSSMSIQVIRVNKVPIFTRTWFVETWNWLVRGDRSHYGVVSRNLVTTDGVRYITDAIAAAVNPVTEVTALAAKLKYIVWGTGTDAETVGDVMGNIALAAPVNNLANVIANGVAAVASAVSGDHAKVTFTKTLISAAGATITEAAVVAGETDAALIDNFVCFDRSLFGAGVVLGAGDGIALTYVWTLHAGG